jgi:hypothetical protein
VEKFHLNDLDALVKEKKRFRPDMYPEDFAVTLFFDKTVGDAALSSRSTSCFVGAL